MVPYVHFTKYLVMTFVIWRSEGPCIDGGLEHSGTIPFFIGDMCVGTLLFPPSSARNKFLTTVELSHS